MYALAGLPAVDGAEDLTGSRPPITLVREGEVAALCTPWQGPPPEPDLTLARTHAALVEAAAARLTVLPVRAGTVLPAGELHSWLSRHLEQVLAALRLVEGQAEFGLKVWGPPPAATAAPPGGADAPDTPGQTYLRGLLAREHWQRQAREAVRGRLAPLTGALFSLCTQARTELLPSPGLWLRAALLVPAGKAAALREVFAGLLPSLSPPLECLLSGPWPPYHFAEVDPWHWRLPTASS